MTSVDSDQPYSTCPNRRQVLVGATIVDISEEVDKRGREWLLLHLDGGIVVHIPDEGMVIVHPSPN